MGSTKYSKDDMDNYIENILAENLTLKRQLESKSQALVILNKELTKCRNERDVFKVMAEKAQEKCSALKKLSLKENSIYNDNYDQPLSPNSVDSREVNRTLKFEVECLRQKLRDALGDVKALRTKLVDQKSLPTESESLTFKNLDKEEELVKQLEAMSKIKTQLEIDLQSLIDEKEELVSERDAYKCKVHRLNHEFTVLLKGENHSGIDIDSLIMENRFLQEHLQHAQEEIRLGNQTISKYKNLLENKHVKGSIKLEIDNLSGMIISQKQVQELLENGFSEQLPNTAATISELKSLCLALLENSNDKTLALAHQKRANRILAAQICQLEQRIANIKGTQVVTFPSKVLLEGYYGPQITNELEESSKNGNLAEASAEKDTCSQTEDSGP